MNPDALSCSENEAYELTSSASCIFMQKTQIMWKVGPGHSEKQAKLCLIKWILSVP